jgi:phage terminase large subunit
MPFHERTQRWACLVAHRRAGKALDIGTPIPMADGSWKTMGQLDDNDRVLDETGKPCNIIAAHPITLGRPCYEVVFSDGASIVCDEDHLWSTQSKLDRSRHIGVRRGPRGEAVYISRTLTPREASPKTTAQIRDSLMYGKEINHSVDCCGPAQYPEADLPIDPYILGAWLGDGTSRSAQITTMDAEIKSAFQKYAIEAGFSMRKTKHQNAGKATTYKISGPRDGSMARILDKMGVLNNKHIPIEYMSASVNQRVSLLRGLMDTDGSIYNGTKCEITQKRKELIEQIAQLLNSLGEKAVVNQKNVNGNPYYRISFRSSFNPFNLKRKADTWKPPSRKTAFSRKRYIVAVNPVPSRPVRCITVDSPNRLYLCGKQYIPTHNTVSAVNDIVKRAVLCRSPNPLFGYIAPFRSQAKKVAWDYLKRYSAPIAKSTNEAELMIELLNGAKIYILGADNEDSIRGLGFDGVYLDEFGDFRPSVWGLVIRPALSDKQGWAVFGGTPKGKNHFWDIYQTARLNPAEWFCMQLKASESGILPQSEIDDVKAQLSEDQYMQEYECSFEAAILGAYYGIEMRKAMDEGRITNVPYDPSLQTYTAWDIGLRDDTSIWWFQVNRGQLQVIDFFTGSGTLIKELAKIIKDKPYHYKTHYLPPDARAKTLNSNGRSTIEQLAEHLGWDSLEVVPRLSVQDGIQAVRLTLPKCWFDENNCREGIEALRQYQKEFNEDTKSFKSSPRHDWASHPADAFRMLALSWQESKGTKRKTFEPVLMAGPENTASLNDLWASRSPPKRKPI